MLCLSDSPGVCRDALTRISLLPRVATHNPLCYETLPFGVVVERVKIYLCFIDLNQRLSVFQQDVFEVNPCRPHRQAFPVLQAATRLLFMSSPMNRNNSMKLLRM